MAAAKKKTTPKKAPAKPRKKSLAMLKREMTQVETRLARLRTDIAELEPLPVAIAEAPVPGDDGRGIRRFGTGLLIIVSAAVAFVGIVSYYCLG